MAVVLVRGIYSDRGKPVAFGSCLVEEDLVQVRAEVGNHLDRVGGKVGAPIQDSPFPS